jgi:outer membrane protein TolC
LAVAQRVADLYWKLWLVHQIRVVQRDQRAVLEALSEASRARLEVSVVSLSDVNQIDLARSRLDDDLAALDESERALSAQLLAAIGSAPGGPTPVAPGQVPTGGLPTETEAELVAEATNHPRVQALFLRSESSRSLVRQARAQRAPSFTAGVDWIETGEAPGPDFSGNGKDPVVIVLGLRLPLWSYAYGAAEQEARSLSEAYRADAFEAQRQVEAALGQTLSAIRDAHRRVALYRTTLIPQAEAAYASVVGAYQTGNSSVAATLLAQRQLLELQLGMVRARAAHAIAWARLEQVLGRPVDIADPQARHAGEVAGENGEETGEEGQP